MKKFLLLFLFISLLSCNESKSSKSLRSEEKHKSINDSIEKSTLKKIELLDKIELTNISLICRGYNSRAADTYGSGVTIYFMINNKSDIGIKRVFLNGTFNFDSRSYSHSEDINYEFRKGLEPGETQEIGMRPGMLSEWNDKIKSGDKGEFELEILGVEDYNEKLIMK